MTLTDFLLARIAEDEATLPDGFEGWYHPGRYRDECEAKRRIVDFAAFMDDHAGATDYTHGSHASAQFALRALAAVYADHPDYDESWRP